MTDKRVAARGSKYIWSYLLNQNVTISIHIAAGRDRHFIRQPDNGVPHGGGSSGGRRIQVLRCESRSFYVVLGRWKCRGGAQGDFSDAALAHSGHSRVEVVEMRSGEHVTDKETPCNA